jgi:hypothetical protein
MTLSCQEWTGCPMALGSCECDSMEEKSSTDPKYDNAYRPLEADCDGGHA